MVYEVGGSFAGDSVVDVKVSVVCLEVSDVVVCSVSGESALSIVNGVNGACEWRDVISFGEVDVITPGAKGVTEGVSVFVAKSALLAYLELCAVAVAFAC